MADGEKNQSREGFAFTSLVFGIIALVTWRWTQVGTVVSVMSVGFGIIALKSKQRLVAGIGVIIGTMGHVLSLITAFLQWP
jgi:hypothetical protein